SLQPCAGHSGHAHHRTDAAALAHADGYRHRAAAFADAFRYVHAQPNPHADASRDADGDVCAERYAREFAHANPDANAYLHAHHDADSHGNAHSHTHHNPDSIRHGHVHRGPAAIAHRDCTAHSDGTTDGYSDHDLHRDAEAVRYAGSKPDLHPNRAAVGFGHSPHAD